ncbi:hypothetical protein B0H13DRAFT_2394031 [Mycena leptocephala]|nr:hypothetical protein B0H13DRAFT_2394031 [Mycena leptocephala]
MASPSFVPDCYKDRGIIVIKDQHFKGHMGTVVATRPGGLKLDVKITDRPNTPPELIDIDNLLDGRTGISLKDALNLTPSEYALNVMRYQAVQQEVHLSPLVPVVGLPSDERPKVILEPTATLPGPTLPPLIVPRPGEWLCQTKLAGLHVDTLISSNGKYYNGKYDGREVCVPRIPAKIESKANARVQILYGPQNDQCPMAMQIQYLHPLITTQQAGVVRN